MTNQAEIQTAINYMKIKDENNKDKLIDNSIKDVYKTAIKALEGEVPVKVIEAGKGKYDCPNCTSKVDSYYCPVCGQHLNWDWS